MSAIQQIMLANAVKRAFLAFGINNASPYIAVYPFSSAGVGTKAPDPTTLPPGLLNCLCISKDGAFAIIGYNSSPYASAYRISGAGVSEKLVDPASPPNLPSFACMTPDEAYVVLGDSTGAGIDTRHFNRSDPFAGFATGFITAPSPTVPGIARAGLFSPAGTELVVGHAATPFISAWPWTGVWGTKFSNPATLPPGAGTAIAFSPDGTVVMVGCASTQYITAYHWSSSGFGAKYSDPATLPAGGVTAINFSPDGLSVIATHNATTPYVTAYPWSNSTGFGTKFSNLATPVQTSGVVFTPDSLVVAMSDINTSPYIHAYNYSSSTGFGSKLTDTSSVISSGLPILLTGSAS